MVRLISALILSAMFSAYSGAATKTCVLIGDSIMSGVADGTSGQHALTLIQAERDVMIRNLSSPGASLAATDATGFNYAGITESLDHIGGVFGAVNCIIIQAITNDYGRSASWNAVNSSLGRILEYAKAKGKKVLVLDPIWRADEGIVNSAGMTLYDYRVRLSIVCSVGYADVCRFASRSNTVLGSSAGSAYYSAYEIAQGKQLHPNAAGHRLLATWIETEAAAAGLF